MYVIVGVCVGKKQVMRADTSRGKLTHSHTVNEILLIFFRTESSCYEK